MISPADTTASADGPTEAATLTVRRMYAKYLADAGLTFTELLIIVEINDGSEHEVTDIATRLDLDAALMSSSIANLERAKFIEQIYPSSRRLSSIQLTADERRIAERFLVIQANVDLDLAIVSEKVNRLRRSLLQLVRRNSKRDAHR
jgi:DNA-binding MarR family transcriptional regulator